MRRGNRLLIGKIESDIREYKENKAGARNSQEMLSAAARFREKYKNSLPLVEQALDSYRADKLSPVADLTLLAATFLGGVTGVLGKPFLAVWKTFAQAGAEASQQAEQLLATVIVGSAITLGIGAKLIATLVIRNKRAHSIIKAFDGAGMKLFERKEAERGEAPA